MEKKLLKTGLIIKMKEILTRLINHENLDEKESKEILIDISMGKYNHEQVASFLTVFMLRGTSTNELIGFRDAFLRLLIHSFKFADVLRSSSIIPILHVYLGKFKTSSTLEKIKSVNAVSSGPCILGFTI